MTMDDIILKRTDSDDRDFRALVRALDADLRVRNGAVMDIYDQHNVIESIDTVIVVYLAGAAAGCACFKVFDTETVEIKRMFVSPAARGNGISTLILKELEAWALSDGYKYVVLETGSRLKEALGLYNKAGYIRTANYGPYLNLPQSLCYRKALR